MIFMIYLFDFKLQKQHSMGYYQATVKAGGHHAETVAANSMRWYIHIIKHNICALNVKQFYIWLVFRFLGAHHPSSFLIGV